MPIKNVGQNIAANYVTIIELLVKYHNFSSAILMDWNFIQYCEKYSEISMISISLEQPIYF